MKVLVLGGAGFVGQRVVLALRQYGAKVRVASRRAHRGSVADEVLQLDALNTASLHGALDGCDAVINCVTGSGKVIVDTARSLRAALIGTTCKRLVHMSSMAAFGEISGVVDDDTPFGAGGGWYADAKREAEQTLSGVVDQGGSAVMLRPGCVHGPGSQLWVQRFGDWLFQRRLGDLGAAGDGWSNLVHVDDVAQAARAAVWADMAEATVLRANLVAPDSPRWNAYILALGCSIGAVPVRRIAPLQLKLDSRVAAVPLRVWERAAPRLGLPSKWAPPALPPSLLHLLRQERRLRSRCATEVLGLRWTPFQQGVDDSAHWYLKQSGRRQRAGIV